MGGTFVIGKEDVTDDSGMFALDGGEVLLQHFYVDH
jgi:hypothetical protein